MCVLSMIRYYVCPFDKHHERFCPYQLFQSHVHHLPVFKMNQFGIEDIFPHSIIHLEALVGDSYELLMWQFKYAYWSARWKLHVECWYWQLVLNNHDCYIAQCFRAIRPPVRFASFVISLVSKIPSIQLPTLSRSLARKLKSGWRLPRHSCVAASFALAEALECKYLRDEITASLATASKDRSTICFRIESSFAKIMRSRHRALAAQLGSFSTLSAGKTACSPSLSPGIAIVAFSWHAHLPGHAVVEILDDNGFAWICQMLPRNRVIFERVNAKLKAAECSRLVGSDLSGDCGMLLGIGEVETARRVLVLAACIE